MHELLDFLGMLFNLLFKLFEFGNAYEPPRRKRVFSLGFLMFAFVVVMFEILMLKTWLYPGT